MEKSILARIISGKKVKSNGGVGGKSARTTDDGAVRHLLLSVYGRTTDALASAGYEGRGRLR